MEHCTSYETLLDCCLNHIILQERLSKGSRCLLHPLARLNVGATRLLGPVADIDESRVDGHHATR